MIIIRENMKIEMYVTDRQWRNYIRDVTTDLIQISFNGPSFYYKFNMLRIVSRITFRS